MLHSNGLSSYGFAYNNFGSNPLSGATITPVTGSKGSWAEVASSASLTQDCYWFYLGEWAPTTDTGVVKNTLYDIGVDPAGGTSYTAIISDMQIGSSFGMTGTSGAQRNFLFPFFVKAGSSVAARAQTDDATPNTTRVVMAFWGQPSRPENVPVGMFSETLGTLSGSKGQSFTPGNAADGTWADFGTTTKNLWWWQMGHGLDNTAFAAEYVYIDVAWGDATNKHLIFRTQHSGGANEELGCTLYQNMLACASYQPVPAGSNIYVRGRCNNAPDTGYHATVIGIGG